MALISNSHICPHLVAILSSQTEGAVMRPQDSGGGGKKSLTTSKKKQKTKHPGHLPLFGL